MARRRLGRPGHILPFRIPFFRIFYSTTYTILYVITIAFLAFSPVSLVWAAIEQNAIQYTFMIGGTYVLVALIAIFIYSSRLYTNRTVLAGVGKAYIPVEDGEVVKKVRKMIVKQLDRSALVAWESRPRDLLGEILWAEKAGVLPPETASVSRNDYTVGREIPLDPANPPWGTVQNDGWSSPAQKNQGDIPDLQFSKIIAELPSLVEAQAVSLAPSDPTMPQSEGPLIPDPTIVDVLRRPLNTGLREYLVQLCQLRVVQPPEAAIAFLHEYERARFSGQPVSEQGFKTLMSSFSTLLSGMTTLDEDTVAQIRSQAGDSASLLQRESSPPTPALYVDPTFPVTQDSSLHSGSDSPVTARTRPSRTATPYLQHELASTESFSSVVHRMPDTSLEEASPQHLPARSDADSSSLASFSSTAGSVVRHSFREPDRG